ncbi:hypothetical protein [Agrococcus sp. SGAir0287]|uniref:hypothetical protein n=1 Tax=Agrococcus sp. SGAir0287 TaxID=2070347 RepID=UPI0010CD497F|nr:hypothetical protein [Agrococcus sp. SGAir0287]QCR19529.1 hypothetical protein C1N71_08895 [Agrococcus sp. SGAir0287]
MSDEHVQGTDPDLTTEEVASGGHQDRAEQWEKDDGAGTHHSGAPQDTADQWAGSGPEATEDAAQQWSGEEAAPGAQDTPGQWYEEGDGR